MLENALFGYKNTNTHYCNLCVTTTQHQFLHMLVALLYCKSPKIYLSINKIFDGLLCLQTSVSAEAPSTVRSLMSSMETSYAVRIMEYNKASLAGTPRNTLVEIFKELSLHLSDKVIISTIVYTLGDIMFL